MITVSANVRLWSPLLSDALGIGRERQYVVGRVESSYVSHGIHVTAAHDWLTGKA